VQGRYTAFRNIKLLQTDRQTDRQAIVSMATSSGLNGTHKHMDYRSTSSRIRSHSM